MLPLRTPRSRRSEKPDRQSHRSSSFDLPRVASGSRHHGLSGSLASDSNVNGSAHKYSRHRIRPSTTTSGQRQQEPPYIVEAKHSHSQESRQRNKSSSRHSDGSNNHQPYAATLNDGQSPHHCPLPHNSHTHYNPCISSRELNGRKQYIKSGSSSYDPNDFGNKKNHSNISKHGTRSRRRVKRTRPNTLQQWLLSQNIHYFSFQNIYNLRTIEDIITRIVSKERFRKVILVVLLLAWLYVLYYSLHVVLSFLFGLVTRLWNFVPSIRSNLDQSQFESTKENGEFGPPYVQNLDQIQSILQLADAEFDLGALGHRGGAGNAKLHSVRYEEKLGMFETISHPGDGSIQLSVPKFYASSVGKEGDFHKNGGSALFRQFTSGKLLTPQIVSMIGSSISSTGDMEDLSKRTIFVSLISHGSTQCPYTVTNLFESASKPRRIRVAVVDITDSNDGAYVPCDDPPESCTDNPNQMLCKFQKQVDVYELNPDIDGGMMFARHIANRMYRNEYYAMQVGIDSDIVFASGWDEELIHQFHATNNEMGMVTTYLSEAKDISRKMHKKISPLPLVDESESVAIKNERITLCHASFEGNGPHRRLEHNREEQVEQDAPKSKVNVPMLQPYWSSEFSFSRGHFVLSVPYDPYLCGPDGQDEEISMALRAYTHGYDFYTPTRSCIYRFTRDHGSHNSNYGDKSSIAGGSKGLCTGSSKKKSRLRLYSLVDMLPGKESSMTESNVDDVHGIGKVRETHKFFNVFGIHNRERITEQKLCDFVVSGNMHDEFIRQLRENGMGIDYDGINFRFHELISIHKDNH